MASPRALLLLVDGVEDIEVTTTANLLRRAGIEVTMAGLQGVEPVTSWQKIRILPDVVLDEAVKETYDVVILPGGHVEAFGRSPKVGELIRSQLASGRFVAAVCAAPTVLAAHGIQKGATITSHPLARTKIEEAGYKYSEERVVVDGKLVTSRGPGTTADFAFKIVEILVGPEEAERLREYMLF